MREVADDADRFVFAHALVRETLYERQSASRRVRAAPPDRAGAGGARAAARRDARRARLPLPREPPPRPRGQGGRLLRAGGAIAATEALAYEEAARALPARARAPRRRRRARRCALLLGARRRRGARRRPGARRRRSTRAADARRERRAPRAARARPRWARRRRCAQARRDRPRRRSRCSRPRSRRSASESPLVARLLARLANAPALRGRDGAGRGAERRRPLELRAAARRSAALCGALESRHAALLHTEHLDERLRLSEELLALAERTASASCECSALHWRAYDLLEAGDVARRARAPTRIGALADGLRPARLPLLAARWELMWAMVGRPRRRGRGADRAARTSSGRGRALPEADVEAMAQQLAIAYRHGVRSALRPRLEAAHRAEPAPRASTCRCSRSRTCRPATARRPRPRVRAPRRARTSPRSRATCCGSAASACSRRSARCSTTRTTQLCTRS